MKVDNQVRVPPAAGFDLLDRAPSIQVNHCRIPDCVNYGALGRVKRGSTGPSKDRDHNYKITSSSKGAVPALLCKGCGEKPVVKSNEGIANELARIAEWVLPGEYRQCCTNEQRENYKKSIGEHRKSYVKYGYHKTRDNIYYRCKGCRKKILVSNTPDRIHNKQKALASDVFSRVVNKSPVRGTIRDSGLDGNATYYPVLDFIYRKCRTFSGGVDRVFLLGERSLPKSINIAVGAQNYTLNWRSRLDRRNLDLWSLCSVDVDSRFVLALHSNFEPRHDAFEINKNAAENNDLNRQEPFRKHAHYWLVGDELQSGRALHSRHRREQKDLLREQIIGLYADADTRDDVEDIELHQFNEQYKTPRLPKGMQTHLPYLSYAHSFLLREMLKGSGVKDILVNMDIDSMSRAAFLCAFKGEVKSGHAHAFYVKYSKGKTVDQRKAAKKDATLAYKEFKDSLPEWQKDDAARLMMIANFKKMEAFGRWRDRWAVHPLPTLNEPDKAMCWLTERGDLPEEQIADMYLRSSTAPADNVFQITRRFFSALEHPIGTSSSFNTVWHGYAPYNPVMLEKYLTIFRVVNNFINTRSDGMTPAMRLDITKHVLTYDDILWAGRPIPRKKGERRRGRPIPV